MSSTIKWDEALSLAHQAPSDLTKQLNTLKTSLEKANEVISIIEKIIKTGAKFVIEPTELLSAFIVEVTKNLKTVIGDTMGLGGHFIVITPNNRMNKRMVNVLPEKLADSGFPIYLPAMTPQEALNEFKASFYNTNDPFRPRWTSNTKVAGVGYILTSPDPMGLVQVANAFSTLFDIEEFKKIASDYTDQLNEAKKEAEKLQEKLELDFSIEGLDKLSIATKYKKVGNKTIKYPVLLQDKSLPSLHWYGLSLNNIIFLKQLIKKLDDSLLELYKLSEIQKKAVTDLLNAILKKIKALRTFLQTVYSLCETVLVSLDAAGVYSFVIPEGVGGINYITNAIENSIQNPTTEVEKKVARAMTATNFSALFFMGASTGINLDAWKKMVSESFNSITNQLDEEYLDYIVTPDLRNAIIPNNTVIRLSVVSPDVTELNPYYFTYTLYDDTEKVVSSFTCKELFGNIASVNKSVFQIRLALPDEFSGTKEYSLAVEVFDFSKSFNYSATFYVSNTLAISTNITDEDALTGTNTSGSPIEATLVDSNNVVIESGRFISDMYIGTGLDQSQDDLSLVLNDGNMNVTLNVTNMVNREIIVFNTLDELYAYHSLKFTKTPIGLDFRFGDAIKIRKAGATAWNIYNIPSIVEIEDEGIYEYCVYYNGVWDVTHYLSIKQSISSTKVC